MNVDTPILNLLSLCSGVGMLDEAVSLGCAYLGWNARTVAYCERDAYAAACLLARMEESRLEPAPVWAGDMAAFDARPFRGVVDILAAGLPCQPYSCAGKQQGNSDRRSWGDGDGPIPHALRIIAECRPALVFLENVPAWVRGGWFRSFGEELCRLGYTIEQPLFITAESVGASHRRERVFILAHALRSERGSRAGWERVFDGRESMAQSPRRRFGIVRQPPGGDGQLDGGDESMEHPERLSGGEQEPRRGTNRRTALGRAGATVGDTDRPRPQGDGPAEPQRRNLVGPPDADRGIFAPGPSADWREIPEALWPAIKPGFRVLADGNALVVDQSRADQLRCGGNGVVAIQGAVAFVELVRRLKGNP